MNTIEFEGVALNVDFELEDIWVTQGQLAEMYKTTSQNITMHISNIYDAGELESGTTCKKSLHYDSLNREREIKEYNLDMILSLGYRINSGVAQKFRQFSNQLRKKELKQKPLSKAEQALIHAQIMVEQEQRLNRVEFQQQKALKTEKPISEAQKTIAVETMK